jgi:site-specific DNA recombinase
MNSVAPLQLSDTPAIVVSYSRYSDDENQPGSSIRDQVRECATCAHKKGWIFRDDLSYEDPGISGQTLSTRGGMMRLVGAVENPSRGFDGVVIDDTNRLGRNAADTLWLCKLFKHYGVFLYFVNQGLDSRDPNFLKLILPQAVADEDYVVKLAHGVIRGMRGRVLAGMTPGGTHYGYRGEIVPDPTRRGSLSRPAILGVTLHKDPVESAVVAKVFSWAEDNLSYKKLAERCNDANLVRSQNAKSPRWTASTIEHILHNPLYKGLLVWGRTTSSVKHPVSGRVRRLNVPESEWVTQEVPELAIVSPEQWDRVQRLIAARNTLGKSRLGGIGKRKSHSPSLFSGLLRCECGEPMWVFGRTASGECLLQCAGRREGRNLYKCFDTVREYARACSRESCGQSGPSTRSPRHDHSQASRTAQC